jgi:hypothetical protein
MVANVNLDDLTISRCASAIPPPDAPHPNRSTGFSWNIHPFGRSTTERARSSWIEPLAGMAWPALLT